MSIHFMLIYAATILIATIIPGPSMLLALTHGMRHGARRTVATALGNLTVTLLQAAVSIAGLGAVLLASETVFQIVKFAGAVYLVYLGITLLRSSTMHFAPVENQIVSQQASPFKLFRQGVMVTAGNPKAIVFFTAVFPQFIQSRSSFIAQFCLLMGIGALIAFGCFMLYALAGQKIVHRLRTFRAGRYVNRVAGGVFILAALGLAFGRK
jgi:homoserine/homoserine lactone efflux protein